MTLYQMLAEIDKLNKHQIRSLRKVLAGRGVAKSINVDQQISKVTVTFERSNGKEVSHFILLGPRGRIIYHDKTFSRCS